MKTRIVLTVALLFGATFATKALFYPAEVIAKNTVAVSTLNGGDMAFAAQEATNSALSLGHWAFGLAILAGLAAIWLPKRRTNTSS